MLTSELKLVWLNCLFQTGQAVNIELVVYPCLFTRDIIVSNVIYSTCILSAIFAVA